MITDSELLGLRERIYLALLNKSGVREWAEPPDVRAAIWLAAIDAADGLLGITSEPSEGGGSVALPDFFKVSEGTAKTIRNSGGTAAITLASLANGNGTSAGGRQSASLDMGANWAQRWRLECNFELAATPTAGNAINLFASWNTATGAGDGNTSGSDAAYTGYSNNIDAATRHLEFLGSHICTSQTTAATPPANVQKSLVGVIFPKGRYLNLVVDNRSGAAFHSTDTNQVITLTPLEESIEETV
jgi:hypothetical protein